MKTNRSQRRITVRDIARRLKVSHTTISRALRDDRRISERIREKVRRTAKTMGYRPDPMLAALAHYRRSNTTAPIGAELAWINCWPDPKRLRFYKEFDLYWQGASEEAERAGYRLEEFCCPKDLSPTRLQSVLLARNIKGLLLAPRWSVSQLDWGQLDWNEFCIVRFGYSLQSPLAHVVTSDQLADALLAVENMRQLGYQRIGMVAWSAQGTRLVRFSAGYLYAQLRMDASQRLPLLTLSENPEADRRLLSDWMATAKPDAILTDISQLPGLLADIGYRMPGDIGMAALSVLDGNADTGINQNSKEVGRVAVQLLISLINHNERGVPELPRELLIAGRWVNGRTLPEKSPA